MIFSIPRSLYLVLGALGLLVTFTVMAASGSSEANALAIASVVGALIPLALKYVPSAGHYMVAITVATSLVIALVAEVASGAINLNDLGALDLPKAIGLAVTVYGLGQVVYATLSQSPKTTALVQ